MRLVDWIFEKGIIPARAGFTSSCVPRWRLGGIIPARAGFTPAAGGPGPWAGDHPRACGVYGWRTLRQLYRRGSSPRVRGLRRVRGVRRGMPMDHPRACGVYHLWISHGPGILGSSPRVRGLLSVGRHVWSVARIIPARAGFTVLVPDNILKRGDHPRACGVYTQRTLRTEEWLGSSPRVRGLQWPGGRRRF